MRISMDFNRFHQRLGSTQEDGEQMRLKMLDAHWIRRPSDLAMSNVEKPIANLPTKYHFGMVGLPPIYGNRKRMVHGNEFTISMTLTHNYLIAWQTLPSNRWEMGNDPWFHVSFWILMMIRTLDLRNHVNLSTSMSTSDLFTKRFP